MRTEYGSAFGPTFTAVGGRKHLTQLVFPARRIVFLVFQMTVFSKAKTGSEDLNRSANFIRIDRC